MPLGWRRIDVVTAQASSKLSAIFQRNPHLFHNRCVDHKCGILGIRPILTAPRKHADVPHEEISQKTPCVEPAATKGTLRFLSVALCEALLTEPPWVALAAQVATRLYCSLSPQQAPKVEPSAVSACLLAAAASKNPAGCISVSKEEVEPLAAFDVLAAAEHRFAHQSGSGITAASSSGPLEVSAMPWHDA